jgi:hypothetical protein
MIDMRRWLKLSLGIIGLAVCFRAAAQTNAETTYTETPGRWVTNWIDAPASLRIARGHSYNTLISPKWQWLAISNRIGEASDDGKEQPVSEIGAARHFTLTTVNTNASQNEFHLTVFHYSFNPTNFVKDANGEIRPATLLWIRALPLFAETNTVNGHQVASLMVDYGLPYTNKIPQRKWVTTDQ